MKMPSDGTSGNDADFTSLRSLRERSGFMVELDEETSRQLFNTLASWEVQLQAENIDFEEMGE